jgi:hypothetical protein
MANSYAVQILSDGPRNAIVKLTGVLDTSNLAQSLAVDLSTLSPIVPGTSVTKPAAVAIHHIDYSIADQLEIQLTWDATAQVAILPLAGRGRVSFKDFGGLQNNAGAGKTGNINITTTGWASGTQVFSIVLEMVKQ